MILFFSGRVCICLHTPLRPPPLQHTGAVKLLKYNELVRSKGEEGVRNLRHNIARFVSAMAHVRRTGDV